jgi:tripartite-type tricarboxylate transporter receptor subunit TctC
MRARNWLRICAWGALWLCASSSVYADIADIYKGKTIHLVNGGAAGSGFDLYSRMLAPWLEKKTGASVIVESRPGAGMMIAMNYVWMQPADGFTLMLAPGEGAVLAKITNDPSVRFDMTQFGILARVNTAPRVMIVNPHAGYDRPADLLKPNKILQIGANGKTDAVGDTASLMCYALKIKCKITIGYKSSADFALAAVRGEVDATILVDDSAARYAQDNQLRGLVVMARERSKIMPDVPTIYEALPLSPEAQQWLDYRESIRKIGRILITPPKTPDDILTFLRSITRDILTDPLATAEFEKQQQPAFYGSHQEVEDLIKHSLTSLSPARQRDVQRIITEEFY